MTEPRLPLGRLAAGLAAVGAVGAVAIRGVPDVPWPLEAAAAAAATSTLLLIRRAPLLGLVAVLVALAAVREAEVKLGLPWPAVVVTVAAFAAGLTVHPRRALWLVPIGVAYVIDRALQPYPDTVTLVLAGARYTAAAGGGVLVRRRLERVRTLEAERDALRRAVESGPAEAVAAEQLRVWSEVQPRTDRVVAELPGHAALAAAALEGRPGEAVRHLEAIRGLALEAFEGMRATVGALDPGRGAPVRAGAERRVGAVLDASLLPGRADGGVLLAPEVAASLERFLGLLGRREHEAHDLRARVRVDELQITLRLGRAAVGEDERAALWLLAGRVRLQDGRLEVRRRLSGTAIFLALPAGKPAEPAPGRPVRRRLPAPGPLLAVCAVLTAAALAEQAVFGDRLPGPAALGWLVAATLGLVPVLAPRRAILAGVLCGAIVVGASAADVLGGPTTTQNFVAALLVAVTGATASPPGAVLSLLAVEAGMLGGLWVEPDPWAAFDYVGLALILAAAWGAGIVLRGVAASLDQARRESRDAGAALADLERRAVLGERVRLAGELHDLVGHALTAIIVQAAAAAAQAQRGRPQAAESIAALAGAADLAVGELARLARVLQVEPEAARLAGDLAGALRAVVGRARRAGQAVELAIDGRLDGLSPEVARAAERIVQEALTNAAKHAAGAPVRVAVRAGSEGSAVSLRVANDPGRAGGVGSGGHGLRSMADRARSCGGELSAGPRPDGGWVVDARLGGGVTAPEMQTGRRA